MAIENEIYVTGSKGLVASKVLEGLGGKTLLVPEIDDLDITDRQRLRDYLDGHHVDTVVNFAAYTDVDSGEKERGDQNGLAWRVNVIGVSNLALESISRGIHLIHISTDFVFPGSETTPGPYPERYYPTPCEELSWYGCTKLAGEQVIRDSGADSAIVRISYPFGNPDSERDFARKVLDLVIKGYPLFSDQVFTPTYIPDLSLALKVISEKRLTGVFHVASPSIASPFEFGRYMAASLGMEHAIHEGSLVSYVNQNGKAPRPILGGLLCEETQNRLGITFRDWRKAVDYCLGFSK